MMPNELGNPRLLGRIAVVTGGLSGIGAAIARRLAAEGARVTAADITAQGRTAQGGTAQGGEAQDGIEPAYLDVGDERSINECMAAVAARHGRLDILVNSAGIGRVTPFLETPVAEFDRIVAVNLRGTFLAGQAAVRHMVQNGSGGGSVVNIASVSGLRGGHGRAAYGASKGGVVTLSQVMAVELAGHGIRVNVIAPGPVESPMAAAIHSAADREGWNRQIPMRRYGTAEEIAGVAAFLCSDDASYVTGHVLAADGGYMACGLPAP